MFNNCGLCRLNAFVCVFLKFPYIFVNLFPELIGTQQSTTENYNHSNASVLKQLRKHLRGNLYAVGMILQYFITLLSSIDLEQFTYFFPFFSPFSFFTYRHTTLLL